MGKKLTSGVVTLSFDDAYSETVHNVLPLLNKYGFKATFNVPAGLLNKEIDEMKIVGLQNLKNLKKHQMEIASHSLTHVSLTNKNRIKKLLRTFLLRDHKRNTLSKAFTNFQTSKPENNPPPDYQKEIIESKILFNKYGFSPTSFVYPKGNYNREIVNLVKQHYLSSRTTNPGYNDLNNFNPYELKSFLWDQSTNHSDANKWVEVAIKNDLWLIETFHLVAKNNKTNYEYFTSVMDFKKHLEYISKQPLSVTTQQEVIESFNA